MFKVYHGKGWSGNTGLVRLIMLSSKDVGLDGACFALPNHPCSTRQAESCNGDMAVSAVMTALAPMYTVQACSHVTIVSCTERLISLQTMLVPAECD